MTIYNKIGEGYNATRQADPYIASRLYDLLSPKPKGLYLDIGCGTGNYLKALSDMRVKLYGVDPSAVMLDKAKAEITDATFLEAKAEGIPLPDSFFDGAIAVLTIHHWTGILKGLQEVNRVLKKKAKLVFFSYTPQQMRGYWLYHYFPKMIDRCMSGIPDIATMENHINGSGFKLLQTEKYFVREDLQDHFLYSNKHRPERYLSAEIRDNISAFSLMSDPEEVNNGIAKLEKDIKSGAIKSVISDFENDLGDYIFLIVQK